MTRFANFILTYKKTVLLTFVGLCIVCVLLVPFVGINYSMADYLPDDAPSTLGLDAMADSFDTSIPNLQVMGHDMTIAQALAFKAELEALDGVESVLWLDDVVDVYTPLAFHDPETVEAWYKDGQALFSVTLADDKSEALVPVLYELIEGRAIMSGQAVNSAEVMRATGDDLPKIMMFVIPLILIVLLLSTSSWLEPLLFFVAIGAAIVLNEGTNIFLGEVSFVTRSTSAILQLAVSMDYAIFLLHSFADFRKEGLPTGSAMQKAVVHSFSAIASSAVTTVAGFLALTLMRFKIGPDLGIVLAKGILCSFICVTTLLPVLAMMTTNLMDKTRHRPFLPPFKKFGQVVARVCIPIAILLCVIIVPAFLGQANNTFIYGSGGIASKDSQSTVDEETIAREFGRAEQLIVLVPEGDLPREAQLAQAFEALPEVKSIISYTQTVGAAIPVDMLDASQREQFFSGGYSRMIVTADVPSESAETFALVERMRTIAQELYPDSYHLTGSSVVNYDLMDTITKDNRVVTVAVVVAIGITLLITFRSLSLPIILLLAIQGATWINLSLSYFTGTPLIYMGYQIVSSLQLGATVDYGILFANEYLDRRKRMKPLDAVRSTITDKTVSILTPASILAITGGMLGFISSNGMIGQLGGVIGSGALISLTSVLFALPGLLVLLDKPIRWTTLRKKAPDHAKETHDEQAQAI